MKTLRLAVPLLITILSLSLPACGGGDAPTGPGPAAPPPPAPPPPPPPNPDRDNDGILNEDDACPDDAEVFNGWDDDDGCPDDTLDFYEFAREDAEQFAADEFEKVGLVYREVSVFTAYATSIDTPCGELGEGNASYCPLNEGVYMHRPLVDGLFLEIGRAAPAVVVAHEIGHHVQNLDGTLVLLLLGIVTTKQTELQADCYAGAWGASVGLRGLLEEGDVEDAIVALVQFGDDNLGLPWFNPDGHGTSLQRTAAFTLGFDGGVPACADVFVFPAADVGVAENEG